MVFGTNHTLVSIIKDTIGIQVSINETSVEMVKGFKYLGVILDPNLSSEVPSAYIGGRP